MLLFIEADSGVLDVVRSNSLVKAHPHSLPQYPEPLRLQKHSVDTLAFPKFPRTAIPLQEPPINAKRTWIGPEPIPPGLGFDVAPIEAGFHPN